MEFIRKVANLRYHLRRYFYTGEMARPPRLTGEIPTVKAIWEWLYQPDNWVSLPAVVTGAWRIPHEHKLVLLFANVSDEQVSAGLEFDAQAYGIQAQALHARLVGLEGVMEEVALLPSRFNRQFEFPPQSVMGLEIEADS